MRRKFVIEFDDTVLVENDMTDKEFQLEFLYDLWLDNPESRYHQKLQKLLVSKYENKISEENYNHLKESYESDLIILEKLSCGHGSIYIEDITIRENTNNSIS